MNANRLSVQCVESLKKMNQNMDANRLSVWFVESLKQGGLMFFAEKDGGKRRKLEGNMGGVACQVII
jgi:hypothetical protein